MNTMKASLNMNREERLVRETGSGAESTREIPLEKENRWDGQFTGVLEFAAGTRLPPETFPAGEELFVLEGELRDEHGEYSAGTYLKNPPGHRAERGSADGCRLFVKRNQIASGDSTRVHVHAEQADWFQGFGMLRVLPLHEFEGRGSALVYWPPGATFQPHQHWGGEEIFVVNGTFQDEHGDYPRGTWIRSPHRSTHNPFSREGCLILVKVGHMGA